VRLTVSIQTSCKRLSQTTGPVRFTLSRVYSSRKITTTPWPKTNSTAHVIRSSCFHSGTAVFDRVIQTSLRLFHFFRMCHLQKLAGPLSSESPKVNFRFQLHHLKRWATLTLIFLFHACDSTRYASHFRRILLQLPQKILPAKISNTCITAVR
jgi:hypothetical protein